MRGKADDNHSVMVGQTEWYAEAGKKPLNEDGFTPQLMLRIEQAASNNIPGYKRYRIHKHMVLTSLAAIMLIGAISVPMGVWKNQGSILSALVHSSSVQSQAAGVLPSASPAMNDKEYAPPVGSAQFEIGGKKYYMPLPLDRDKNRAYAVETTAGILWSPPPPMVDYKKPKYTHPTEPFTLYLSSKDQMELSPSSAARIYTFPLYAGSASTYQYLNGFYGAGDYILLVTYTRTLGADKPENGRFSILNVKEAAAGETAVPKELTNFDETLLNYKYLIAVDKEYEQLIFSYLEYPVDKTYQDKTVLFDLETLSVQTPASAIGFRQIKGDSLTMDYEVDGGIRKADILVKGGFGWIDEDWAFLSEERRNKLYQEFMSQLPSR